MLCFSPLRIAMKQERDSLGSKRQNDNGETMEVDVIKVFKKGYVFSIIIVWFAGILMYI